MDETSRVLAEISVAANRCIGASTLQCAVTGMKENMEAGAGAVGVVQKFTGCGTLYWHSNILSLLKIQVTDETYELLYLQRYQQWQNLHCGRFSRLKFSYGAGRNISIGGIKAGGTLKEEIHLGYWQTYQI